MTEETNERQEATDGKEHLPSTPAGRRDVIPLGKEGQLDISGLPEADRNELLRLHAEGRIDLEKKMLELGIENQGLSQRLSGIVETARQVADMEASATITGAYNDRLGRTEVIVGNTKKAAQGQLDRSQKGEADQTFAYVIVGAIVLVILAFILAGTLGG